MAAEQNLDKGGFFVPYAIPINYDFDFIRINYLHRFPRIQQKASIKQKMKHSTINISLRQTTYHYISMFLAEIQLLGKDLLK